MSVVDAIPAAHEALPGRLNRFRPVFLLVGVLAVAAGTVARIGRFGFNPSDQGFVLAATWRILHGEIPHVDVVSPRPLGSAYLHVLDFLVPAPLMLASGFVMMAQLSVATIALAALLTGWHHQARARHRSHLQHRQKGPGRRRDP
ncbi:hypothetical protein ATK36_1952 [Amycolatopsis sulphurea]|uniref:Uncharacterized protein n=1 Tax=Amycolatopsis sulphurea TaxID=76022 RepID=A0A2A9F801_9PSEU|nr:hypothetical protein [Amycolatopsis sulphurea]PFG46946.1 hypothetical protein ATK36_1952 [Amycolatopsis sulphurea]